MGPEQEQAVLEEVPPAPLLPRALAFDRLGLLPLPVYLSRSAPTREEGMTRRIRGQDGITLLSGERKRKLPARY